MSNRVWNLGMSRMVYLVTNQSESVYLLLEDPGQGDQRTVN